jgi:hypothetical protein
MRIQLPILEINNQFNFEGMRLLGHCVQIISSTDRSTRFGSSLEEGDQIPGGNIGCDEGSYDS